MSGRLTGKKVLIIALASFGVVIAANLTLLFFASGSFPGLVVKNSYVAGMGWDARVKAQRELGWQTGFSYHDGSLEVSLTDRDGNPVRNVALELKIGRPARADQDRQVGLRAGEALALELDPGQWRLELSTTRGPAFHVTGFVMVPERS